MYAKYLNKVKLKSSLKQPLPKFPIDTTENSIARLILLMLIYSAWAYSYSELAKYASSSDSK